MKVNYTGLSLVIVAFAILSTAVMAANAPTAPSTLEIGQNSTFNSSNYALKTQEAIAGNISSLIIYAIGQTKSWQGFYGNISATITLDDANNYTFYNWTAAEPRGQVYATLNDSIVWGQIGCFGGPDGIDGTNETLIEGYYNIQEVDVDGVNETFIVTDHPDFEVASRTMTGCPTAYINQDDVIQSANFVNVLLSDPNLPDTGWIYTTLIENKTANSTNDLICYNGEPCDFQILVNEDGHGTDVDTTTYYFWVELI